MVCLLWLFQFTLPCRERRDKRRRPRQGGGGFNSRSRVGSDKLSPPEVTACHRFNSRSRVGSDTHLVGPCPRRRRFNSRSRVGSDLRPLPPLVESGVSIHAPV